MGNRVLLSCERCGTHQRESHSGGGAVDIHPFGQFCLVPPPLPPSERPDLSTCTGTHLHGGTGAWGDTGPQ